MYCYFYCFFIAFAFKCKAQDFTGTQVDPEITGTIDYEKLREMFLVQQKMKIIRYQESFLNFVEEYKDKKKYDYINVGDYKVWTERVQTERVNFSKDNIPIKDFCIDSSGAFSYLSVPKNLTSTVAFSVSEPSVEIANSLNHKDRYGHYPSVNLKGLCRLICYLFE